jgi:murein DD-endopeptidase MepM/ murein hydrolase activator NlpD
VSIKSLGGQDALALHQLKGPDIRELRMTNDQDEAAKAFESYMVEMMVKEMRKTVPDGMFSGGSAEVFSSLFDQELSNRIAESGGFGFGDMLKDQMAGPDVTMSSNGLEQSFDAHVRHRAKGIFDAALPVEDGVVTSKFGKRSDPFHGKSRNHKGLDIAAPRGTPIQSIRPGTVVSAGDRGGYGNVVVLDHGDGTTSLYAHCDELKVAKGDKVGRGDVIATVGSTGRSTGPHLHLEVHRNGAAVDPMSELENQLHNTRTLVRK